MSSNTERGAIHKYPIRKGIRISSHRTEILITGVYTEKGKKHYKGIMPYEPDNIYAPVKYRLIPVDDDITILDKTVFILGQHWGIVELNQKVKEDQFSKCTLKDIILAMVKIL